MKPGKNGVRTRLYILIGLFVLFVAVGYFRYFHKKDSSVALVSPPAAPPTVQSVIPQDAAKGPHDNWRDNLVPLRQPVPSTIRNIFSPGKSERMTKVPAGENSLSGTGSALKLSGTIVGSGKSIAIINNQFLRTGQSIAGFRVVQITKYGVLLRSESQEIFLKVLPNPESK